MKLKPDFDLRDICGRKVLVPEGLSNIDYSSIIHLNETAAYLWEQLKIKENFELDDMVALLMQEYNVSAEVAKTDCSELLSQWHQAHLLNE
ncbi:MAG: PqqD family protein [Bacteroidales bacterium]|nr:PqqD family protein [Bacteroidales bacterium]